MLDGASGRDVLVGVSDRDVLVGVSGGDVVDAGPRTGGVAGSYGSGIRSLACRQRCGMETTVLHVHKFHPPTQMRLVHTVLLPHMAGKTAGFLYAVWASGDSEQGLLP